MMTMADRLTITSRQLSVLEQAAVADATLDDMEALVEHLRALGEHGRAIHFVADRIAKEAPFDLKDVQLYLKHAGALFEAAQTLAGDAGVLLRKLSDGPS